MARLEASQALGAPSASIQDLYTARARGEVSGFTVPAINIRAQTFDMARTVYEAAQAGDVGAVILELARSEQTYTFQRPTPGRWCWPGTRNWDCSSRIAGSEAIPCVIWKPGGSRT